MTQLGVRFREVPSLSVAVEVIGRTGEKLRLRAPAGRDLFDDPLAAFAVGDLVHVDVTYPDGGESCAANVIGRPSRGVVEVELRADLELGKGRTVRIEKARMQGAKR